MPGQRTRPHFRAPSRVAVHAPTRCCVSSGAAVVGRWTHPQRPPARPSTSAELRRLTLRLAADDPTWGYRRRPRRTCRARPPPCCVHGLGRSSTTPESTPHPHAPKSPGRSSCGPRPPPHATSLPSTPSRCAGSTCCCASTSLPGACTSQGSRTTPAAFGPVKPPEPVAPIRPLTRRRRGARARPRKPVH